MEQFKERLEADQQIYIFAILGLICIIFHEELTEYMPVMIGLALFIVGLVGLSFHFIYNSPKISLGNSFVYIVGGLAVMLTHEESLGILGIIWALISLREVAEEIDKMYSEKHFSLFHTIMIIVSTTLAVLLLTDPFGKFAEHMVILGLEMISTAFTSAHHVIGHKIHEDFAVLNQIIEEREKENQETEKN